MDVVSEDKKYVGRDVPAIPIDVVKTVGNYVYDSKGKKYIDFLVGWNVGNIGWGVKEVKEAIKAFDGPDYVNPYYLYKPWVKIAKTLIEIAPGKLAKAYRATGGTEAVEIALQAAMAYTKRSKFVSVDSYHGHSIGAMSVGYKSFRNTFTNLLPGCEKVTPPLNKETAAVVEEFLSKGDIAAYISEPIICNLGVVIPTHEYFTIVQAACKKFGTVFIVDEVATGFGRTGRMFASELFGLEPDILCLAKGLTGGYGVMGATLMTDELARAMEYEFSFYSTFGWHPLNVAAAQANLDYLLSHKEEILRNVEKMSKYFKEELGKLPYKYPVDIRVQGLAIGLESQKEGYLKEVVSKCLDDGLITSELGSKILTLFPALNIDTETAKEGLKIFARNL